VSITGSKPKGGIKGRTRRSPDKSSAGFSQSGLIREAIFGINDGLVATVGLVSGEALAHQPHRAVLIAALSAVGAAVVSMAVGSYLATGSENEFMQKEILHQRRQIEHRPERERQHVRRLLEEIGIPPKTLAPAAANIVRSRSRWLNFMVREHLGIHVERQERPLQNAGVMGLAVIVGSAPPVVPFLLPWSITTARDATWALAVASALALGAVKAHLTETSIWKSAAWFGLLVSLSSMVGSVIGLVVGRLA
jgi:VIT1/CCC1 family predicted Fe2+/Mn2+ transporter